MPSGNFGFGTTNTHVVGDVYWEERNVNTVNNTSDVYIEMRMWRNNTGYETYGTGNFYVSVNGVQLAATGKSYDFTYNSNTLVLSGTVTGIQHNGDGSKAVTVSWSGNGDSGFTINAGSGTAYLTTIPRASTATSSVDFTMGTQNLAVTLDIKDSSFHQSLELFVQHTDGYYYSAIGRRDNITSSSYTWAFTSDEITAMYQNNGGYENRPTILRVWTYNSSGTQIGDYQDKTGTAYAIATSTVTIDGDNSWAIGTSIPYSINSFPTAITGNFTFNLILTLGSFSKTFSGLTAQSGTLSLTTTERDSIYSATPNSNTLSGTAELNTYYNGVSTEDGSDGYNTTQDITNITAVVTGSNPIFTTIEYHDINTTVNPITGNDQYIVQNKSNFQAKILNANKASGVNAATISKYIATFNGVNVEVDAPFTAGADILFNFGTVNAAVDMNLTITVYDSRGNTTAVVVSVHVVPYTSPVITATALRDNGFLDNTVLQLSGSISKLTVNGTDKNGLIGTGVTYQYRVLNGTYNSATQFSGQTLTNANFTATAVNLTLANTSAWEIQVAVQDKLGTSTVVLSVGTGVPIVHIDDGMHNMGIGKFPSSNYKLDVAGNGNFVGKLYENTAPVSPVGSITAYAGVSAPTGWLVCDGSAISRTTYAALFAVLDTRYGVGDGSTTFNIPNLGGRVPVGVDTNQNEFRSVATYGGEKTHILTPAEMPSHNHTAPTWNGGSGTFEVASTQYGYDYPNGAPTSNTGGDQPHNNLQPYLTLNFIIRVS
jgi:microcystin-dependent protein